MIRYRNALFIPNIEIRRGGGEDPAFRSTSHLQHKSYYSHTNEKKVFVWYHIEWSIGNLFSIYSHYTFCVVGRSLARFDSGVLKCVYSSLYIYSVKVPFRCSYNIRIYILGLFQLKLLPLLLVYAEREKQWKI